METILRIRPDIHSRLKAECKDRKVPLKSGANVLLTYALDALEDGGIELGARESAQVIVPDSEGVAARAAGRDVTATGEGA